MFVQCTLVKQSLSSPPPVSLIKKTEKAYRVLKQDHAQQLHSSEKLYVIYVVEKSLRKKKYIRRKQKFERQAKPLRLLGDMNSPEP